MATKLYLQNDAADIGGNFWEATSSVPGSPGGTGTLRSTTTTASASEIQLTATTGGSVMEWVSGYAASAFTLSGTISVSMVARESANSVNAKLRVKVWVRSTSGSETLVATLDDDVEMLTTDSTMTWTGSPTSTSVALNERLVFRFYVIPSTTMGAGSVASRTAGADGLNFVQINETVTFTSTENTSTTYDKSLSANLTLTATMRRLIFKRASGALPMGANLRKTVTKGMSAALSLTATLARIAVFPLHLVANMTAAASIRKEIAKGLSAPITATASIVKTVSKGLSATCSLTAAIAKAFPVHLSASLTASASITKTIAKSLVASLGLTATMQRVKTAIVHLSASVSLTASLATIRVFQQALSASITLTASMTKTISKRLVATQSMIARPIRWVATLLAATRGDKPNWNQCARCSRKVRPNKLLQQMEYRGPRLIWTGLYVCSSCIDEPQPQGIWPRETGGDPKPVILARPRRD